MKNIEEIAHSDQTIVKHAEMYEYYRNLCEENRKKYPEVADYIARSYYYNIISNVFNLTPNYVCAIICRIVNDERNFQAILVRAKLNLEADQEN